MTLDTAKTRLAAPDTTISAREVFGLEVDWQIPAFSEADERVPDCLLYTSPSPRD